MTFDSKTFLKALTQRPGVYQMLDDSGAVLYVGKAKNLRKRVGSYFRNSGLAPKTAALVEKIADVQVTVTETEVEALILEQNLIKQYHPTFNVLLRDDKSYPYIFFSTGEPYPRLALHRGAKRLRGDYFGPFPSAGSVRESMSFLQKTFKVRQCEDSFFRNRSRPCLQYQIRRCSGPCVGLVSEEDYQRDVRQTRMFLEGRSDRLQRELEREMDRAATGLAFEKAAECRDRIAALRRVQAAQVIESGRGNIDVLAAVVEGESACVQALYIRHGRILGSRSFYPRTPLAGDPSTVLEEFIPQYYLKSGLKNGLKSGLKGGPQGGGGADIPGEIIAGVDSESGELLSAALSSAAGKNIRINSRVRSTRAKWVELARRTASQNLAGRLASRQSLEKRFKALRDTLKLEDIPERIECFDISHSSGEATVASCVVFGTEGAIKSDYRRFNIEGVAAGDDYAAMEQALRRRYQRLQKGEGIMPDLLLIDGGKGQLRRAATVLEDLGVQGVMMVGVAKGITRKPGMETLLLALESGEREFRAQSAGLHLIQQIRDEAHRFAITGHRQRRDKKRRTSPLENIPGVGPRRRRELLRFFGGQGEVAKASVNDLMRVPSISRKVAETIYSALHSE